MNTSTAIPARRAAAVRPPRAGARAYLAVAAALQTPIRFSAAARRTWSARWAGSTAARWSRAIACRFGASLQPGTPRRAPGIALPTAGRARLRILPGPQIEWFRPQASTTLTSVSFRVSPRSNRMGYRLEGPPLARKRDDEPISEPLAFGAIQVPAAGEPILLMADRQTAGGYPKIASVIAADLPLAGQLAPGDFIEFAWCSRQEAAAALIARERPLLRMADHVTSA